MKDARFFVAILSIALLFLGGEASKAATLSLDLDLDTLGIQSTSALALNGYPFGVGAELRLGGELLPVTLLQGATVTVVQLPPMLWLFATGMLTLLGIRYRRNVPKTLAKKVALRWAFPILALISPLGFAAPDSNADLNGDAMVTSQDISKLASCFGQDPSSNSDCTKADMDEDGDIDGEDFSFVSGRLGEAYPWTLYPTHATFSTGNNPTSVVVGDVNRDGSLDTVVANKSDNDVSILLGNGDGTFQTQQRFAAGDVPSSVTLGDVNGDDLLDVVTANESSDDISVLLNNGDSSFQAQQRYSVGGSPYLVALGDVNGDNLLDVVVGNNWGSMDNNISLLIGNGDGSFQAQRRLSQSAGVSPNLVTLVDINGDGLLDLVVTNYDTLSVMPGNGDGSFQAQQRLFQLQERSYGPGGPISVGLGDVNGDGALDGVVARSSQEAPSELSVFLGNGDGSFQAPELIAIYDVGFGYTNGGYPISVAVGDVNGDGPLDVIIANSRDANISVLPGNGDGSFQSSQLIAQGVYLDLVGLDDLNADGIMDVVVVIGEEMNVVARLGTSEGFFQGITIYPNTWSQYHGSRAMVGDLNGDGIIDMLLMEFGWDGWIDSMLVRFGNGDGSFQEPVGIPTQHLTGSIYINDSFKFVDINGDGADDAVSSDFLALNNGDGTLQEPQYMDALSSISLEAFGDVNGDGISDVAGLGDDGDIVMLLGNGDGGFQEHKRFAASNDLSSISLDDVNGDGPLDIVGFGDGISIVFGNGDGSFQVEQRLTAGTIPSSADLGDVNGDGTVDMVGVEHGVAVVLLGNGDGSFQEQQHFVAPHPVSSVSLIDINGDDMLDLLLHGYDQYLDILGLVSVLPNKNNKNN